MKDYILFVHGVRGWSWYKDYKSMKKCRKVFEKSGYQVGKIMKGTKVKQFLVASSILALSGCFTGNAVLLPVKEVPENTLTCKRINAGANGTFTNASGEGFSCSNVTAEDCVAVEIAGMKYQSKGCKK